MRPASLIVGLAAAMVGSLAFAPDAAAEVIIIGSLSNFDTPNNSGHDCNEFDIEFEGPDPEDVVHCYHNWNYGPPRIERLPNVPHGVRIIYDTPQHDTVPGSIEHFGVSFRAPNLITAQRFQWIPGTVGVPNPPPPPPPPPPLEMPTVESEIVVTQDGVKLRETVTNNDAFGRSIWVVRRVVVLNGEVALEQLMPEDPIMDDAEQLDLEPERIEPGQTLVTEEDAPFPGTTGSVVISYDCHEDSVVGGIETPGNIFATALVANISDGNLCEQLPTVVEEPQDLVVQEGDDAQFFIVATDPLPDGDFVLEWRHEGVVVEPDSDNVTISNVTQADAGLYACYMTNGCGRTVSRSAQLIVVPPPCDGDANGDRTVNGADLSVLLGQFGDSVTPGTGADFNASGDVNGADLSVLLGQFGTNCN